MAGVALDRSENRLYPMRELVADLLPETGSRAKALAKYEATLRENPNRLRATYGAAIAASAAGDRERAGRYFAHVVELMKDADSSRVEMSRAKEYLARK